MIKKIFIVSLSSLLLSINLYAQVNKKDSSRHARKTSHFIGVQANALIRQILNFGNANNPINNPYLLTYSLLDNKSKWGFDAGLGYTLNNFFQNDGNTKRENYINDLYGRIGVLKLIPLNRRFSSTFNFHLLIEILNSKTNTESDFGSQIQKINSNTSSLRYGAGPSLGFRYKVSNRVFVGTEASYYFKMGNNKSKVTSIIIFNGQTQQTITSESDNDFKEFMFNVPTAIYLTIRL